MRSGNPWLAVLSGAAIIVALTIAGPLVPLVVEVAEAQEESSVSLPALRVPTSDPASDYVNDRIAHVTAQAEAKEAEAAAEAAAAPPAGTTAEPAAESGAAATETGGDAAAASGETPPETKKGKDKSAGEDTPAEGAPAEGAPAEGSDGTTASLSGSDVVVSSVGESDQVDKPGRHGKRRR